MCFIVYIFSCLIVIFHFFLVILSLFSDNNVVVCGSHVYRAHIIIVSGLSHDGWALGKIIFML
jgi:hypothetical protein